jgi:hypothetical protein
MSDNTPDPYLKLYFPMTALNDDRSIPPLNPPYSSIPIQAGTLRSGVTPLVDPVFGNCMKFDGSPNAYIQLPAMDFDYSAGITVEAWVNHAQTNFFSRIIDFGNGEGLDNIVLANEALSRRVRVQISKGTIDNAVKPSQDVINLNQWQHIAFTIDALQKLVIYVDGAPISTSTPGNTLPTPSKLLRTKNYIGKSNYGHDGYFQGKMAHLRVYNRALTQAEISYDMWQTGQFVQYTLQLSNAATGSQIGADLGWALGNRTPIERLAALELTANGDGTLSGKMRYHNKIKNTTTNDPFDALIGFSATPVTPVGGVAGVLYDVSHTLGDEKKYPGGRFAMPLEVKQPDGTSFSPALCITSIDIGFEKNPGEIKKLEQGIDWLVKGTAIMSDGSTLNVKGSEDAPESPQ